ncbi:tol-pal system YbgF family protein [Synechococcus sp. PROS-U-1]|uniref:tetratricopeptide repeat protein n=1 Tax=Synechococcus sp. PROS-U-1 TaxID=1400866 RepID=UPI0016457081|nr:hypothetical protein [Synechococcus sp. PROS-U-1]QNJ01727.1 hypothetical protein SynPROSU1_00079 [Synechococcus sp. PROS-U-1]
MDADFEQPYQAAERAYGLGEYAEAHALALELWDKLQKASEAHDPSLVLGWRAVVSLLLGHIQLHGLQQPHQASVSYQQVLKNQPDATIAALAEQGLKRCRLEEPVNEERITPATEVATPDLLKDPFLNKNPNQDKPTPIDAVTAMPWLACDPKPQSTKAQDRPSTPTPVPIQEPSVISEATAEEHNAKDLLENSWIRIQLQPEITGPIDSNPSKFRPSGGSQASKTDRAARANQGTSRPEG